MKKKKFTIDKMTFVAFTIIPLILYTFFYFISVSSGIYYSLTDWNGLNREYNFVLYPQSELGSETEYEQYGESPSLDYRSEIKCCGDNVNILKNTAKTQTINGVTFTVNKDGTVIANGTATAESFIAINTFSYIANQDYMLSGCPKRWK